MLLFIIRNELPQVAGTNTVCSSPEEKTFLQSAFNWCRRQKQNNHTARRLSINAVGFFFWIYCHSSFSNKQSHNFHSNHGIPFSSVHFSGSVVSDSLRPHESQHARPPCPSPTPGVHSDLRPSSQWCHPAISSILCLPLLLLSPIPPSIRVFSNESTLRMRWPKYWSFSFSIIPSKEHPALISFRLDLLDLL